MVNELVGQEDPGLKSADAQNYPPASKAHREVANLTERQNLHARLLLFSTFSFLILQVTYQR